MSLPHAILGFLQLGPATGYELKKTFDSTVRHFWSADQSQIYRTLGLIVERRWARTELVRQRSKPNKNVYSLTDEGREEFLRWLRSPLPAEEPHVAPLLRLFFAGALPDEEVAAMLGGAAAALGGELRGYRAMLREFDAGGFQSLPDRDRLFWRATVEYGIAVTRAQKNWMESLKRRLSAAVAMLLLVAATAAAQGPTGGVAGRVVDAATREALIGASVQVNGTALGAATDTAGRFSLRDLAVGEYVLRVSYIGYRQALVPDVVVRSGRTAELLVTLEQDGLLQGEVVVQAQAFRDAREMPASAIGFSNEEIRRDAGTAGDISRILMTLPGVAKSNDTRNDLVVRGGSPAENAFYIDGFAVPNINHYPQQGASGGSMGIINTDLVRDLTFSAGAFPARYGDRLSSVMDISLREGNRERVDLQVDLNFSGAGVQAEGPLPGLRGSWMLSLRRSYLDFLLDAFSSEQLSITPAYGDVHAKVNWELSPAHSIELLDIFSADRSGTTADDARTDGENSYGHYNTATNTGGVGWTWLWSANGFSRTTVAYTLIRYDQLFRNTRSDLLAIENESREHEASLRTVSTLRAGQALTLEWGLEALRRVYELDLRYGAGTDLLGRPLPDIVDRTTLREWTAGAFAAATITPVAGIAVTPSLRCDYVEYGGGTALSPRLSIAWEATPVTSVYVAGGLYRQALPVLLRAGRFAGMLDNPLAWHAVVGATHMLAEDTRLTVEAYDKEYDRLPVDPAQPMLCVLDELALSNDYYGHTSLVSEGRGRSWGVEATLQKKLLERLYGTVSASWSRSRYRAPDGVWHDRLYDNRLMLSAMGGWRAGRDWELSLRWLYAGGAPYTPFDAAASAQTGSGVLDAARIGAGRLPAYHSLNLRADKRFFFERSTLTAFLSIWNVYARKNVPYYRWNEVTGRVETPTLWTNTPLPVFGIEYEF